MTPEKIYNNCRVCRLHFCDADFGTNNRLKDNVVPHLNVSGNLKFLFQFYNFLTEF